MATPCLPTAAMSSSRVSAEPESSECHLKTETVFLPLHWCFHTSDLVRMINALGAPDPSTLQHRASKLCIGRHDMYTSAKVYTSTLANFSCSNNAALWVQLQWHHWIDAALIRSRHRLCRGGNVLGHGLSQRYSRELHQNDIFVRAHALAGRGRDKEAACEL